MNLLMLSGDRSLAAGERGPFCDMLEVYRRHWDRIDIVCPRLPRVVERQPFENVRLHPAPVGRLRYPSHIAATAHRLARERPYGLMVSHDYGLFRNAAGARRVHHELRIPWVSEIHHVDGHPRRRTLLDALRIAATHRHVRRALPRARAFRVVSRQVAGLLGSWGVPASQVLVLGSLYLDYERLFPPPDPDARDIDVLFCARLEPEKGIDLLLETLAVLTRARSDLRVTVVGRGSRQALVAAHRSVELIPWVESFAELTNLYRRARVLLCTSWSEGNPRVVAEAMACGAAVVSVPVGRVPEWIVDRENGRLVDRDARLLAEAVDELLVDRALHRKITTRAPDAVRGFDRATVLAELARTYQILALESIA